MVAATVQSLQGVDILVSNAAIVLSSQFLATTEAEWDEVMRVNLKSVFHVSAPCVPEHRARISAVVEPHVKYVSQLDNLVQVLRLCARKRQNSSWKFGVVHAVRAGGGAADAGAESGAARAGRLHHQHVIR